MKDGVIKHVHWHSEHPDKALQESELCISGLKWDQYGRRRESADNLPSEEEISTCMEFFRACMKPRKTPNPNFGSYFLKHRAEVWGSANGMCSYVPMGALLIAAIRLNIGGVIREVNAHFCMGEKARGVFTYGSLQEQRDTFKNWPRVAA